MNQVLLIGALASTPELHFTASGTAFTNFWLHVDRPSVNGVETGRTDRIRIACWGLVAQNVAELCREGSRVRLEGRLQTHTSQNESSLRAPARRSSRPPCGSWAKRLFVRRPVVRVAARRRQRPSTGHGVNAIATRLGSIP